MSPCPIVARSDGTLPPPLLRAPLQITCPLAGCAAKISREWIARIDAMTHDWARIHSRARRNDIDDLLAVDTLADMVKDAVTATGLPNRYGDLAFLQDQAKEFDQRG